MLTRTEIARVCRDAADQIQKDGLAKDGTYGSDHGPKCAIGALRFVRGGSVDKYLDFATEGLAGLFKKARPRSRRENIVAFNDAARTRKHDVVELLRDMAVMAVMA